MKKIVSLLIVACLMVGMLAVMPIFASASQDEIEISSVEEWMLYVDGANVDKDGNYKYADAKFVITADVLDFTGKTLTPAKGFNGELDGQGATLKNITMTKDGSDLSLFCEVGEATIKNLVIESSSFTAEQWVAPIACCVKGPAVIENIYVASDVTVVSNREYKKSSDCSSAGGIIGGCFSTNDGTVPAVTVKDCVFAGSVSGTCKAVGGIVGNGNSEPDKGKIHNIVIENCLVLGSVSSDSKPDTSGFVGGNNGASVTVTNSIYAGKGFYSYPFGKAATFTATNCYTIQLDVDGMAYSTNGADAIAGVTLVTSLVDELVGTDATLTLDGWTKRAGDVMVPTGVAEFALSTADEFEKTYTITWKNDEEVLATEEYKYGETPTFKGETPTKASDDTYNYTFVNWTPSVGSVIGDATYYAEFIKVRKNVVIDDEEEEEEDNGNDTQKPLDTTPETESAPTTETEAASGGCGGSIGIAGVAMLALVSGAALVIKKKD